MSRIWIDARDGGPVGFSEDGSEFDPLTILGELTEAAKGVPCEENANRATEAFACFFRASFKGGDRLEYFDKMQTMRKMIHGDRGLSLADFEKLRTFLDLGFTLAIAPAAFSPDEKAIPVPLRYDFMDLENALHADAGNMEGYAFVYDCSSMADAAFAVLHYLLWNGYKFAECEHCERIFATKTFKRRYCRRRTPCAGWKEHSCAEAVDLITKKLSKRRKSIRTYLSNHYPGALCEFDQSFDAFWFRDGKKARRDWRSLETLERITHHRYVKETWYRDEYKTLK